METFSIFFYSSSFNFPKSFLFNSTLFTIFFPFLKSYLCFNDVYFRISCFLVNYLRTYLLTYLLYFLLMTDEYENAQQLEIEKKLSLSRLIISALNRAVSEWRFLPLVFLVTSYLLTLPSTLRNAESIINNASTFFSFTACCFIGLKKSEKLEHALSSLLCRHLKSVPKPWLFFKHCEDFGHWSLLFVSSLCHTYLHFLLHCGVWFAS